MIKKEIREVLTRDYGGPDVGQEMIAPQRTSLR